MQMSGEHVISLQPGTVIGGKYEVVKCLGAGSMGMVYACRHRDLQGQLVAAKVLFHEVAADKVAAARFRNEVLASYGVSHPNVVRAYEFIRDGDLVAYTMEFVGGGDLADRLSRPELMPIEDSLRLLSQMAAGVQAIHDAGIVHRDLKPENILLTNDGTVKIADFGIARKGNGPKLTEHGGVVGTIEYVSPEYMLKSQVDWRSDLYAFGILAYELIVGEAPFKGDSAYALISKRLQTDPAPPSSLRPACPPELDALILKALQRDPVDRYQSATELFYDLQRVAAVLGVAGATGKGILIPPEPAPDAKPYVGPSLNSDGNETANQGETQMLTTDGSIEYSRGGSRPTESWGAEAVKAISEGAVETSVSQRQGRGRQRNDSEVLSPSSVSYDSIQAEDVDDTRDADGTSSAYQSADPMVPRAAPRSELRIQRGQRYISREFPMEIVERGQRRQRVLDFFILLFAALSGVGFGYIFLKLFAPSFLEQLSIFGFGT
jgi:serine/threonine protein kinase